METFSVSRHPKSASTHQDQSSRLIDRLRKSPDKTRDFLKDSTAVIGITYIWGALCTGLAGASIKPGSDILMSLSQMLAALCSLYLMVVPLLRSPSLQKGYRFWFRAALVLSFVTSLASVSIIRYQKRISDILALASTLLQLFGTLELVECFQAAL